MSKHDTVETRKLENHYPPTPKPREEGKQADITPNPHSSFLESTVSYSAHSLIDLYIEGGAGALLLLGPQVSLGAAQTARKEPPDLPNGPA